MVHLLVIVIASLAAGRSGWTNPRPRPHAGRSHDQRYDLSLTVSLALKALSLSSTAELEAAELWETLVRSAFDVFTSGENIQQQR